MFFEKIVSEHLAHYSYIFGDGVQATVVDPRRDVDVYLQIAAREGTSITHIFETHRHEDFVLGSFELARQTGAQVLHAPEPHLDYRYGIAVQDCEAFHIGRLRLQAQHTPGHTLGHMGYLLHDPDGAPWIFFSGDALFAGDVGRVDFFGADRMVEMAGMLYDSLFERILPLGDEVLLCPAHGAGSVCGSEISDRLWTTIGLERKHNPRLQYPDKASFAAGVGQVLGTPPYFATVELLNVKGAPLPEPFPAPPPMTPEQFELRARKLKVLDLREVAAFGGAHIPGSLCMYDKMLSNFSGWFLPPQEPVLLVPDGNAVDVSVRRLLRLGFDHVAGYLAGGMYAWLTDGLESDVIPVISVQRLKQRMAAGEGAWFLDVRREAEKNAENTLQGHDVQSIVLSDLMKRAQEVPSDRPVYVFCRTSQRAMLAASLLKPLGFDNLSVVAGGITAWLADA